MLAKRKIELINITIILNLVFLVPFIPGTTYTLLHIYSHWSVIYIYYMRQQFQLLSNNNDHLNLKNTTTVKIKIRPRLWFCVNKSDSKGTLYMLYNAFYEFCKGWWPLARPFSPLTYMYLKPTLLVLPSILCRELEGWTIAWHHLWVLSQKS